MNLPQYAAVFMIALAVIAVVRGFEVRLTLLLAAFVIGALAGKFDAILRIFLDTFSNEKFVLPICSAMGFAYVIRHTGCDAHLVRLLVAPVRRMKSLVIPGVVLVAFTVNIPVISQTSTAVCVGPVVIPLLRAAGYTPLASAATLCLGASIGGELLNPGAPELQTVTNKTGTAATTLSREVIPPLLAPYMAATILVHWVLTRFLERRSALVIDAASEALHERFNLFKALVPLTPLVFLFLTGPPWFVIPILKEYLHADPSKFDARLIAVAMLIGVMAAAIVSPRKAKDSMKQFFEGAGYGFAVIVSLIVTANCFGQAIKDVGLASVIGEFIKANPSFLVPLTLLVPALFAFISGSGMASTQSLYDFFHDPAASLGENPDKVGAAVSIGSAAGRSMSPVAAVVLMCATMTNVQPFEIVKRLAVPLISGLITAMVFRLLHVV